MVPHNTSPLPTPPARRAGRRRAAVALAAVAVAVAAAGTGCGGGSGPDADGPGAPAPAASGSRQLHGVCPDRVVVQTAWFPTADIGVLYQLLGDHYKVDANHKTVSGPLLARGENTGVTLEVRSGGPAIGFQTVPAQMYADPKITLGTVATDDTIMYSAH